MSARSVLVFLLVVDSLAIAAAIAIESHTGVDHFGEGGFITLLSCLQLILTSFFVFRIKKRSISKDAVVLWAVVGVGFLFLAADELFKIHEHMDSLIHQVFRIQETGLTDRIDDGLVGLYGLIGIGVLYAYRKELIAHKDAFPSFIVGFVLLLTMVAMDLITNRDDILSFLFGRDQGVVFQAFLSIIEDSLKIYAESFFALAFYVILRRVKSGGEE